jgi:hypothetical protein
MAAEREFKLTFLGDSRKAVGAIGDVEKKMGGLQAKIPPMALGLAGVGVAAGVGMAGGMIKAATETAAYADSIEEASIRTGLQTDTLQELTHAANLTGSSMEGLENSVRKMQRFVADASEGNKTAIETLDRLGVKFDELEGKSVDEQFMRLAGAVAAVEDDTLRADAAMTLFGKSGTALLPMLDEGADGLQKMRDEAHRLGLVMSEEDVAAAAELQDNIDRLTAKTGALKREIGNALIPVLMEVSDVMLSDVFPAIESVVNMIAAGVGAVGRFVSSLEQIPVAGEKVKNAAGGFSLGGALTSAGQFIPGANILPTLSSVADMLGFDSGGVVPGPRGAAQMAIVHGGETILPTHKGGGGMGNTYVFNIGTMIGTDSEAERVIARAMTNLRQRGALPA